MNWSPQDIRRILPDASIDFSRRGPMAAPGNPEQALELVRFAVSKRLRICPSGTAAHLDTDSLPDDCLIVSSKRLNRIVDCAPDDLYLTLESGYSFANIAKAVGSDTLGVACDALSYDGTVGGAFSLGIEGKSGSDTISIRQSVVSASVVMPYGKLIRVGAVTLKSVAGYDVARFLAGSCGRLGFIVSVTLRLTPRRGNIEEHSRISVSAPAVRPAWNRQEAFGPEVWRNLKTNLDPAGVFPDRCEPMD